MKIKMNSPLTVCLLALLCCALWGSAYPCIKIGYQWLNITGTGSQILFAGYRFFLSGILSLILGSLLEKRFLKPRRESLPVILRQGLLQTVMQYLFFYIGIANTSGTSSSIISASNGFISIIAAHFLLSSEKMTLRKGIGCILGLSGVTVMSLAGGPLSSGFSLNGEGMIILGALGYGLSTVTLKMIADRESPSTITAYQILFGGTIMIIIGWLLGGQIGSFDRKSILLFLYLAAVSTVAFTLWAVLIKHNSVGQVAVYGFTVPIFGVMMSGIVLHEKILTPQNIIALGLVCIGIVIVNRVKARDLTPIEQDDIII